MRLFAVFQGYGEGKYANVGVCLHIAMSWGFPGYSTPPEVICCIGVAAQANRCSLLDGSSPNKNPRLSVVTEGQYRRYLRRPNVA